MVHKLPFAVVFLGLVFAAGCSGAKPVTVQGKIILPKTVKLVETDNVEVRFIPEGAKAKAATAIMKTSDMTFTTPDILPGKYKVFVKITPYAGMPGNDKRARDLQPLNHENDEDASKLSVEVGSEPTQSITIDLAAKSVKKD